MFTLLTSLDDFVFYLLVRHMARFGVWNDFRDMWRGSGSLLLRRGGMPRHRALPV